MHDKLLLMPNRSIPPTIGQPSTPQPSPRRRRRTGGSRFSWKPASFEDARSDIELARQRSGPRGVELARVMPHVIASLGERSKLGGLQCPSPASDSGGTYRIGIDDDGRPDIQRLNDEGVWVSVVL
jgi:hypothetical protein